MRGVPCSTLEEIPWRLCGNIWFLVSDQFAGESEIHLQSCHSLSLAVRPHSLSFARWQMQVQPLEGDGLRAATGSCSFAATCISPSYKLLLFLFLPFPNCHFCTFSFC